jgi:hypothetical protein
LLLLSNSPTGSNE